MAIQFARCQYVSRSTGGNACRKAAYNERGSITCERTGETFSYATREEVAHHEILLPQGADPKFADSSMLWNEAERAERRKDSQVAKEFVLALPDDEQVTLEARIELTRRFATENFVQKGVAVQIDIHEPDQEEKNWHAHLLVTTRRFQDDGQALSSKKATDLDPMVRGARHTVIEADVWGEIWRDTQNIYFAEKGYDIHVDPIGILAQEHLGPVRMRHHMNEALEHASKLQEANEQLSHQPVAILEALTRHRAVFTERDVDVFLNKHVPLEGREGLKENILTHLSVLPLYDKDTEGASPFFTTQNVRAEEEKLLRFTDAIASKTPRALSQGAVENGLEGKALSEEQHRAYEFCVSGKNLSIIQGRAGVGKSYVLDSIRAAHEAEGFRVLGLAPTHKVTLALKESGFGEAKTCHGFLFALKHSKENLNSKTLVVVDEAAMMGSVLSVELFHAVKKAGSKLILVGDDRQLSSVERPGAFAILAERYGAVELHTVRRQSIDWQKAVSESLSQGNVKEAVQLLQIHKAIDWQPTKEESLTQLLNTWAQNIEAGEIHQILAHRNVDVDALNQGAREILKVQGKLEEIEIMCPTQRGPTPFAVGDRIQLTKTDKEQGLENGRFGKVTAINAEEKTLALKMDNGEMKEVDPSAYDGLRHGYAATVYKAQGSTLEHVYVLHGLTTNQSTSYVALTRQIKSLSLHVSQNETPTEKDLIWQMGRSSGKGSSLEFATQAELERQKSNYFRQKLENIVTKAKDIFHHNAAFYQVTPSKPLFSVTPTLQSTYEEMGHPAFTTPQGLAIKQAFEKGRLLHGEEKALAYWDSRKTDLLNSYQQDLEKVEKSLLSPAFSHLSQEWKNKTWGFAKEDPAKTLSFLNQMEEKNKNRERASLRDIGQGNQKIAVKENEYTPQDAYLQFKLLHKLLKDSPNAPQSFHDDLKNLAKELRRDKHFMSSLSPREAQEIKQFDHIKEQERIHSLSHDRGGLSL